MNSVPAPYSGPSAGYERGRGGSGPPPRYGGGGGDRREMSPGELYFPSLFSMSYRVSK